MILHVIMINAGTNAVDIGNDGVNLNGVSGASRGASFFEEFPKRRRVK